MGTGMADSAGKEDPVELDSILQLLDEFWGVDIGGSESDCEIPLLLISFYLARLYGETCD